MGLKLRFKKLDVRAIAPSRAHPTDAGLDLTAIEVWFDHIKNQAIYQTGLAVEIPPGHVGLIFPRSSICKKDLSLTNAVGVIDSGYRGEIKFVFRRHGDAGAYAPGDRIGQLVVIPYPQLELEEVPELSEADRGDKGFGSSGAW